MPFLLRPDRYCCFDRAISASPVDNESDPDSSYVCPIFCNHSKCCKGEKCVLSNAWAQGTEEDFWVCVKSNWGLPLIVSLNLGALDDTMTTPPVIGAVYMDAFLVCTEPLGFITTPLDGGKLLSNCESSRSEEERKFCSPAAKRYKPSVLSSSPSPMLEKRSRWGLQKKMISGNELSSKDADGDARKLTIRH
ncbi:uncharacterized protein EDB91DRAFT_1316166 [Suillus paluster]|uniref:uncharacterized protein n=1 Tax=Suillus paluster TaxID=48578 RepID=UPI001B85D938|nr:uncharacterized protein EDB91DRAFT_1316166 [Suillus paluster]KAG1727277.1 hypothetical protein EDB91DRAFT_1316166 [Suillus paluster]